VRGRAIRAGAALLSTALLMGATSAPKLAPVRVDHHMHVHSPAILAFLPAYCESPGRIGKCAPAFLEPLTPEDLLAEMDRAGVRRGLIMSTGYLAESPMVAPARPDAAAILRSANDWTVGIATKYSTRLSAFVGINPITPSALPEITRWRGDARVTGVKLHLTNSGVDLRKDSDVAALAGVFGAAAKARLAIMIHMRTRAANYGAQDVRRFLADVLPRAGNNPVQIAHAGGWGGIDANTLSALGAFAEAIEADRSRFAHVWFDLAAVWKADTKQQDKKALVTLIRRIGPAHFLPASDWPFSKDLVDYYRNRYPLLPLTTAEWTVIRTNVAPYARH
jgi:predicted TIM-barrel fold metal-dependent hydrolase